MRILVTLSELKKRHRDYLERQGQGCEFVYQPGTVTREMVEEADIIIGNVPEPLLCEPERLQWLQLNSAGADTYCKPGVLRPGTFLTNATGAYGLAISEHMLGQTLMLMKRLDQYHENQMGHRWRDEGKVTSVYGSTTLILGMGDIGSEYGLRMKALGSRVLGIRRKAGEKPDFADAVYTMEQLDQVLPEADIVAMSLPNTPETYHMMNRERLAKMKSTALLLNVGRGTAIDQDALNEALREGRLGGCAVDVTDPEPLPADHPLWDAPRTVITPHISGQYHLQETFERIVGIAGENLEKFLAGKGEEMKNLVDFETGYRRR